MTASSAGSRTAGPCPTCRRAPTSHIVAMALLVGPAASRASSSSSGSSSGSAGRGSSPSSRRVSSSPSTSAGGSRRPALRLDAPELDRGLLPQPARRPARAPRRTRASHEPSRPTSSCSAASSRSCGSPTASCSSRWRPSRTWNQCDLLAGPNLREARVVVPAGELDLEKLAAVGEPAPGEAQFLRFVQKPLSAHRAAALAIAPRAPAVLCPGPPRAGRPCRPDSWTRGW